MRWYLALLGVQLWAADGESLAAELRRFTEVYAKVEENAADPVAPGPAFETGALPGMLRPLDPHSVFFSAAQFEQLKELERSTRKGFGSIVSLLPGRVIVLQALAGTPSGRAGLMPGDEILAINGIRLDRLDIEQLVQLLTESRQQQATLEVRRPGNARLLQFVLTPEDVDSPSVDRAFLLREGVGFIRLASFDAAAGRQVQEAIERLGGVSLRALVLDLRNNPGGILNAALETAALFLQPGQVLVTVKGRAKVGEEIKAPTGHHTYGFPLAVLVNGKSASAAEIVAGALQDHRRAVIVGEPTFGKGLVQSVYPLSGGAGLALTTAFYYTPAGRNIQRPLQGQLERSTHALQGGIQPDRLVTPEAMTPLRAVLEASGAFPTFATEAARRISGISKDYEVPLELVDEFKAALAQHKIQPSVGEWSKELPWIRSRLTQEILNQVLGVAAGDEVELRRDPVVRAALEALGTD